MDNRTAIIANNKTIADALRDNENLFARSLFDCLPENDAENNNNRIEIPHGLIRTSDSIIREYHLSELFSDRNTCKNWSYTLQLLDYLEFVTKRFGIWGPVQTMFYKYMIIIAVSLIETLVMESASQINEYCKKCKRIKNCEKNINKTSRENMKNAVEKLSELGILKLSEQERKRLKELYDYRNCVHIGLSEENEYTTDKYDSELLGEVLETLKTIDDMLLQNAVPYYEKCIGLKSKDD